MFDENIRKYTSISSPDELRAKFPASKKGLDFVNKSKQEIKKILDSEDNRKIVIVGPCSIHDEDSAIDYANRLKILSESVSDKILIVMRCYFEKPRTSIGWKGLISDPDLNNTFKMEKGLGIARKILCKITDLGLGTATEFLDPIIPQYVSELISWAAIGARTVESQTHRQLASGLSMPVGLKNATSGDVSVAINALISCGSPHSFLGITNSGQSCIVETKGNKYGHIILRGGKGTNYHKAEINELQEALVKKNLNKNVIVDCSHANSEKDYHKQKDVLKDVVSQIVEGNNGIVGVMLESHIEEGSQSIPEDLSNLKKGVSITDSCIGWSETERIIIEMYGKL